MPTTGVTTTIVDQAAPVTTTTTLPQNVADPIAPGPVRAGSTTPHAMAVQLTPTLPPPPPTTTTLPPAGRVPVAWCIRSLVKPAVDGSGGVLKTHLVLGPPHVQSAVAGHLQRVLANRATPATSRIRRGWRYMVRFAKGGDGDNIGFHEIPN